METEALWKDACDMMRPEMGAISFDTWIAGALKPVLLEDDTFYVEASSDFHRSFVEKRYAALVANSLTQAVGRPLTLKIVTPQQAEELKNGDSPAKRSASAAKLNPKYTFDTFVVGNNNRFAHAASLAVAESPADAYNPLFIYGGVGLGKTHLMHAIGHFVLKNNPKARIEYITTEMFTNELISAIQSHKNAEFRDRYRNVDVLLVDDIQFLAKAERTQEEFFHTFNALHSAGKQIVISSDKPPKEIPRLEERLSSRFEWGLIADIQKPDLETRIAILQRKAQDEMMKVDDDVLGMIAERVESNIRELEGCLTRLSAYAALTKRPIDVSLAEEALREVFQRVEPRRLTCEDVINAVANYYTISVEDIIGARRNREITVPRQVAMYLCRTLADVSFPRIGDAFKRDHSTIQHGCDKVEQELKTDTTLASQVSDISRQLKER